VRRLLAVSFAIALAAPAAAVGRTSIANAPIRTVKAGQGKIAYRSVGHGPPLVLIMGLSGSMNAWEPAFVDALAAHHRVITFDNEGVGASTLGPGTLTIRRMARDTASLIRALRLRKVDVMGWSMGGMIAQALAHDHPELVRRMVLCATAPGDGKGTLPGLDVVAQLGGTNLVALVGLLFPAGQEAATQDFVAGLLSYKRGAMQAPPEVTDKQLGATTVWLLGNDPAGKPLRRLKLPVLIGAGARDQLLPVANDRHLADALPNARLRVYGNAAHGFLFQEQASFVPLVLRFLAK
jgi:pimeloyl-ACP methyl ester carboxylesterase